MYEYVPAIELGLHRWVRTLLQQEFGPDETGWWRRGIPTQIRQKCVNRREEDDEPSDAFTYTDLIDLSNIMTSNWPLFRKALAREYRSNRKAIQADFARLNGIRNSVMHPVKDRRWSEDDFQFVQRLREAFTQVEGPKPN